MRRPSPLRHGVSFSSLALALLGLGCESHYIDSIGKAAEEPPPPPPPPPPPLGCEQWRSEGDCRADTAHGCSFQPNTVGCLSSDPTCSAGNCRAGDPFVRRSGEALYLHAAPFRFVGSVCWATALAPGCDIPGFASPELAIARIFDDMVGMRANVLKIWAFQRYAGASGTDFSNLDRVVGQARRAGVRLIFVLENHRGDCSSGDTRNDAWYESGYREPYGDYALSYPDYVTGVVAHFRDEPTLFAWELMHEARGDDPAIMLDFVSDVSSLVRRGDPNHLIALGIDNGDSTATSLEGSPPPYRVLHQVPAIDLIDMHDFGADGAALPSIASELKRESSLVQKPIFAGATAVDLEAETAQAFSARANAVEAKLVAAFAEGFAGYLGYDYFPNWKTPSRQFDGREEEPLAGPNGVFARHALAIP